MANCPCLQHKVRWLVPTLESNRKGLAIRSALFAEDPSNADYRCLLAIGFQNDGKYHALLHDVGGALQSFRNKLLKTPPGRVRRDAD